MPMESVRKEREMSILIKGIEMPKAGNWKTIRIYYEGTCAEPNCQGDCKYIQGCEAIPVHPHGRLIDVDAVQETVLKLVDDGWDITRNDYKRMSDILYECPTIIEAEV